MRPTSFRQCHIGGVEKLDEDTLLAVFEGVPQFEVSRDALAAGVKAVDLFVDNAAVFASKGEMRKLVQGGGVSLNKENWLLSIRLLQLLIYWMTSICWCNAARRTII